MIATTWRPPFQLPEPRADMLGQLQRAGGAVLSWVLALPAINDIHRRAVGREDGSFAQRVVEAAGVRYEVPPGDLLRIPATGPLVVVANHPFGAIDGMILMALLDRVRPDARFLANTLLECIPELRQRMFGVDVFGGPQAVRANTAAMRAALRHVRGGGALLVFPAGEVSTRDARTGEIADKGWQTTVIRLIRRSGAPVLPVYFAGGNSALFHAAGRLHPRLRTLLLPREVLRLRGKHLDVRLGSVIPAARLAEFATDDEAAAYLRVRTYLLAARSSGPLPAAGRSAGPPRVLAPIAPAEDAAALATEIEALGPDCRLGASGPLEVHCAPADQLPTVLREIGRLREIAFRDVGEGSGRTRDLDEFDATYLHLFLWHRARREIIGAYRLGLTDRILPVAGQRGLYTSTLFHYRDELLRQIDPAIELGRSFVRPEYQRDFAPLTLLWKGIATFVVRQPRYRRLIGPVSISNNYQSMSRRLLMEFLQRHALAPELARGVEPRNPPLPHPGRDNMSRLTATIVRSIEAVDEIVGDIEAGRAGVPVLLRHYLRLNARLLGFNVDPDFGDVLDGLMLVDLLEASPALFCRYVGRKAVTEFYAFHGRKL